MPQAVPTHTAGTEQGEHTVSTFHAIEDIPVTHVVPLHDTIRYLGTDVHVSGIDRATDEHGVPWLLLSGETDDGRIVVVGMRSDQDVTRVS
jgi:hypothetical protein